MFKSELQEELGGDYMVSDSTKTERDEILTQIKRKLIASEFKSNLKGECLKLRKKEFINR